MVYKMGFPLECKRIDSLLMSRRETAPASRALEHLSLQLGGKRKKSLDNFQWQAIVNPKTEKEIREKLLHKADVYCRGDVREGVGILRQFAKSIESSGRVVVK